MSSKKPTSSPDTEQRIVTELDNLAQRRVTLITRRNEAAQALVDAKADRAKMLSGDPASDLSEKTRVVSHFKDELETIDGVLTDIDAAHSALQDALVAERDRLQRRVSADVLDRTADTIDRTAVDAEAAIKSLAQAARAMIAALPSSLEVARFRVFDDDGRSHAARVVSIIIAEGLAAEFPEGFLDVSMRTGFGRPDRLAVLARAFDLDADPMRLADLHGGPHGGAVSTSAAAAKISSRLRKRALRIIEGSEAADLEDVKPETPSPAVVDLRTVGIISLKPFSFIADAEGGVDYISAVCSVGVPKPVADIAVARGFAILFEGQEATDIWTHEKRRRDKAVRFGDRPEIGPEHVAGPGSPSLGDPCGFLAERED